MSVHQISPEQLGLADIARLLATDTPIALSPGSVERITACRQYLEEKLENHDGLLYGINTGFGSLCNIRIPAAELRQLQENLVLSHACGMGERVPAGIVKLMLLLKIQSLAYGHSGIQLATVERLVYFYNNGLLPVVYSKGSLGASGDLAPLAHLSLPLLGKGEFMQGGKTYLASEILREHGLKPLQLGAKEGLALLNGTQFMSAYGCWALLQSRRLSALADLTAALSADAWFCKTEPYLPFIHQIRPHPGQIQTAQNILKHLEGSDIATQPKEHVQDPYAFRCVPQVHGATKGALAHVAEVFETEINSVTDNPNIFPEEDLIISGGNFHGQPLAIGLDYLAIAMSELGSISERRCYNLISGKRGLPEFLVAVPGLNSGMMIPQYTAAAMASENKQLCTPASVDSILSSNGQEDHVSMGANAATKLLRVLDNVKSILAIEWMNAAQAMEFRRPLRTSPVLEKLLEAYRQQVPKLQDDRLLHDDMVKTVSFMEEIGV